jgi:hypothetical protein
VAKHFRLVNYQKQIKMQVKALKLLPLRKTELPVPLHQKPRTAAAHEHQRKVPPWNLKGDMMVHHRVLGESIFSNQYHTVGYGPNNMTDFGSVNHMFV